MRRLLLLRHAKTERTNLQGDHARCLIDRGQTDAESMGAFMQREGLTPDFALVSDAARAQQTYARICLGMGRKIPAQTDPALYLAPEAFILDRIRAADDDSETLLVIGHNPGIHQFAYDLGQRGPHKLTAALAASFPTCALAVIETDAEHWAQLHATNCRLSRFMTAKALRVHEVADVDDDS